MKILVTGGAGFIGSAVVRQYVSHTDVTVVNVDKLTYAGNLESLGDVLASDRHIFENVDICDNAEVGRVFCAHQPDAVMHLAAESHVDRSIHGPAEFVSTNILGTYTLLEAARSYWADLAVAKKNRFRFHHISTDEVFGDLDDTDPPFTEATPYAPSSPYSASKAASDHLVRAWFRTFGLPVVITNCSNNYGPFQFPEKLIPLTILNALDEQPIPVYGSGQNVRDWLFVEDHAEALRLVLEKGEVGETYNIGGQSERTNIDVVTSICRQLDALAPCRRGTYETLIQFVPDRPGHDRRYAIDCSLIQSRLHWKASESFESGLTKTIKWYLDNAAWISRVKSGAYREWLNTNYANREASR